MQYELTDPAVVLLRPPQTPRALIWCQTPDHRRGLTTTVLWHSPQRIFPLLFK
jgi:hypothetical protein